MSDVSESLRSLTKNEQCEGIAQVAHFFAKTSDSPRKPMSEFPALPGAPTALTQIVPNLSSPIMKDFFEKNWGLKSKKNLILGLGKPFRSKKSARDTFFEGLNNNFFFC